VNEVDETGPMSVTPSPVLGGNPSGVALFTHLYNTIVNPWIAFLPRGRGSGDNEGGEYRG